VSAFLCSCGRRNRDRGAPAAHSRAAQTRLSVCAPVGPGSDVAERDYAGVSPIAPKFASRRVDVFGPDISRKPNVDFVRRNAGWGHVDEAWLEQRH